MTKIREITPHKGGRTARLTARLTPETKRRLKAYCKAKGITIADWIEQNVERLSPTTED